MGSTTVELINGGEEDHGGCVFPAATFAITIFNGFADVVSGIAPAAVQKLQLYPNPTANTSRIRLGEPLAEGMTFQLRSVDGQLQQSGFLPAGSVDFQLPTLAAGVYFLSGQQAGKRYVNRIVIR